MHNKKLHKMEEELQHDKVKKPKLMSSLKKHFGVEEEKEESSEKMEKKYNAPRKEAHKNMDKGARKTLAISIMKKKMKD